MCRFSDRPLANAKKYRDLRRQILIVIKWKNTFSGLKKWFHETVIHSSSTGCKPDFSVCVCVTLFGGRPSDNCVRFANLINGPLQDTTTSILLLQDFFGRRNSGRFKHVTLAFFKNLKKVILPPIRTP